jgi:signal transduction histidine kinase
MTLGLETLDLAKVHEQALIQLVLPSYSRGARESLVRRAGAFFAQVITPLEQTHRTAHETNLHLGQINDALRQRTVDLVLSNRQLQQEIAQRRLAEESLRKSELHYSQLLEQSRRMQEQLRLLSRQLLSAQEEERKRISRELHDVIAQTLTSINVRLAALKAEAKVNVKGLEKKITHTQRLVEKSVDIVHRFARELRPAVLDDLGLIPALHSFMNGFTKRTGIRIRFRIFAPGRIKQLNNVTRTVFYRVVQEALTNVARHAQASLAEVTIETRPNAISVKIKDNGKSFDVERVLHSKANGRLGLLGMRERLEMVGGKFTVTSAPGKGTTVLAEIPLAGGRTGGGVRKTL